MFWPSPEESCTECSEEHTKRNTFHTYNNRCFTVLLECSESDETCNDMDLDLIMGSNSLHHKITGAMSHNTAHLQLESELRDLHCTKGGTQCTFLHKHRHCCNDGVFDLRNNFVRK